MITNGYDQATMQQIQQILQTQHQLEQQQPTQEDKERTQRRTEDLQNKFLNKNINSTRECNRLIIPYGPLNFTLSVHCPSPGRYVIPDQPYNPQWLFVKKETYDNYSADIYVGYDPSTLQPEGFAMRDQFRLMQCKRRVWVYGIQRIELDPNIDTLFDLDKLRQLLLLNVSYV